MQGSTEASTSKLSLDTPTVHSPRSGGKARSDGRRDPASWSAVLRSGFAGGVAGCVAKTSVAPLDRVKILFQTGESSYAKFSGSWSGVFRATSQIWQEAGVRGLLQGHSATLLRIFPYAAIKFMAYESLHRALMPTPSDVTSTRLFVAGAAAGVSSVFLTYPLELVRVRLAYDRRLPPSQLNGHSALVFSILKIYHEGDPPPHPKYGPALSPPNSVQHPSHISLSNSVKPLPPNSVKHPYFKNPSRLVVLSSSLFQQFPILKFYRGFVVSVIGMVPYAGTSFLVWGWLKKRYVVHKNGTDRTSTTANLAYGAVAGACAQTASYPFEVVRRRMQVGGILRPDRFFGFWETFRHIYASSGWRGFYVGLSIGYLKVVPLTAISYATWDAMKRLLNV